MAIGYVTLFGFLAYGTYYFTNMATIRDWPTLVSEVDIIWGTCLTSFSATLGYLITRQLRKSYVINREYFGYGIQTIE